MVIAGGSANAIAGFANTFSFNGAGDGDRRRDDVGRLRRGVVAAASTEPAMVIAGGPMSWAFVREVILVLQRSWRW